MNISIEDARAQMIKQQVRAWDVLDPTVLNVLGAVRRELYVPEAFRGLAFADTQIPLGHGEVMMTPQQEGRLLQALRIGAGDRILEVGTGSGFLTACLAQLGARVDSLEIRAELAEVARQRLRAAGVRNAAVSDTDVYRFEPGAPYDVIAVTGSVPTPDSRFQGWLSPGGRLFLVCGEAPIMEACLIERLTPNDFRRSMLFETLIPPLINAPRPAQFVF